MISKNNHRISVTLNNESMIYVEKIAIDNGISISKVIAEIVKTEKDKYSNI